MVGRRFGEGGEPEPQVPALFARGCLLAAERRDIRKLERALEGREGGHVVDRRAGGHLGGLLFDSDQVAATNLCRFDSELARDEIEHALTRPALRLPRAAERDVHTGVRRDDRALECEVLDAVRVREQHAHEIEDDRGREHGDLVRALVQRHVHARAEDRAVARDRHLDVEYLVARVPRRQQVLEAILDPLHRTFQQPRRGRYRDLFATRVRLLTERTSDVAAAHGDQVGGIVEQRRDREPQRVRVLVRDIDHELAGLRTEVGEERAAFHRHVGHAGLLEVCRNHLVGTRERPVGIAVNVGAVVHHVGAELVEQRGARRIERVFDRNDRRERLDVDVDQLTRVLRERATLGHDQRDRLTGDADLAFGQGWVRGQRELRRSRRHERTDHHPRDRRR